jgi:ABC-2 type transport system permease protein
VFAVFKKEINSFFSSLTGYIVILVFLLTSGLILWVFPGSGFNIPESGYATLDPLFVLAPWLFLFLIPAVTMRTFAEEKKSGTIELLLTRPLTDFQIVFAKYASAFVLVTAALIPTLIYVVSIYYMASPAGNVDLAGIAGSYIGLLFLCSGFVSIGIFCSVITGNQVVSFIVALIICFFFYNGFDFLATIINHPLLGNILAQAGISIHYTSLSRGVIDTRDLLYFLSLTALFIFLSRFALERRKWS